MKPIMQCKYEATVILGIHEALAESGCAIFFL